MPILHVSNGFTRSLATPGKNSSFPKLSEKRVTRCVREEALRPHYGDTNVRVSCHAAFDAIFWIWRVECEINGKKENYWITA
jgi:hypothetical protein